MDMDFSMIKSLAGLPNFLIYFFSSVLIFIIFCRIYLFVTPYDEITLIKEGKTAPAISFSGAVIGFVIPLASAVSHSVSFVDMLIWAVIAMIVQIVLFISIKSSLPNIIKNVSENSISSAIFIAVVSVAIGIINAASMTY